MPCYHIVGEVCTLTFYKSFFFTKKPACERGVRGGRSREMLFHIQSSGGWHSVHFATVQCYPLVLFYCSCTVAACVRRCILYNRNNSKKKKTFILITCYISRFCTSPHIVAVRFMDRYSQDKSCISIVHANVQMIQPAPSMYTNTLFKPPVRPPIVVLLLLLLSSVWTSPRGTCHLSSLWLCL